PARGTRGGGGPGAWDLGGGRAAAVWDRPPALPLGRGGGRRVAARELDAVRARDLREAAVAREQADLDDHLRGRPVDLQEPLAVAAADADVEHVVRVAAVEDEAGHVVDPQIEPRVLAARAQLPPPPP